MASVVQHCIEAGPRSVESGYMRKANLGSTFFALFGLIFSVSGAFALPAKNTAVNTNVIAKKPQRLVEKAWALPVNFEYANSLHEAEAYERSTQEILNIAPNYKMSERWSVGALGTIYRDDSNGEDGHGQSGVGNTLVSTSYSNPIAAKTVWKNTLSGTLPTDAQLREKTTYQGAVRVSSTLIFSSLWNGSSFVYSFSLNRNFHELNRTSTGGINVRETVGNTAEYSLPIYQKLGAQSSFNYTLGQTYQDDMLTKFSFDLNLTYDFAKNFSAAIGTSNEGNALGYNGRDSNIEFFNKNTSVVKIGLTYIL